MESLKAFIQAQRLTRFQVQHVNFVSSFLLFVGVTLILYVRSLHQQFDRTILLFSGIGLLFIVICIALSLRFQMKHLVSTVLYLWAGYYLGIVSLSPVHPPEQRVGATEEVANVFLVASLIVKVFVETLHHFSKHYKPYGGSVLREEAFLWLGYTVSLIRVNWWPTLCVMNLAVLVNLVGIRQKSFLTLLCTVFYFVFAYVKLFPRLSPQVAPSMSSLIVYIGRLTIGPVLDFYFSSLSIDERWWTFIQASAIRRYMTLLVAFLVQCFYLVVSALFIANHKEWYIVIIVFALFAAVWFGFHLVCFIALCQLIKKVGICLRTYESLGEGHAGFLQIMASKGIRHFALVNSRLFALSLCSTILVGLICWETHQPISLACLFLCLPLETLAYSAFLEMGSCLGGTCIGYVIVSHVFPSSSRTDANQNSAGLAGYRQLTLLSPDLVQDSALRCTKILTHMQRFFTDHMVEHFGSDYSSAGHTIESLTVKLRTFFQQVTHDGPRHDTYILYYSGPTFSNGDWALADGGALKLSTLVELWQEVIGPCRTEGQGQVQGRCHPQQHASHDQDARLLLILDSLHSEAWTQSVRRLSRAAGGCSCCVAVQTARILATDDAADQVVGRFTRDWVLWNRPRVRRGGWWLDETVANEQGEDGEAKTGSSEDGAAADDSVVNWRDKQRPIRASYAVSRSWTDFTFHLPTSTELGRHWEGNFPRCTWPLMRAVNTCSTAVEALPGPVGVCHTVVRCLRRKRMLWLPPFELDTGHGFRLVRSPK